MSLGVERGGWKYGPGGGKERFPRKHTGMCWAQALMSNET